MLSPSPAIVRGVPLPSPTSFHSLEQAGVALWAAAGQPGVSGDTHAPGNVKLGAFGLSKDGVGGPTPLAGFVSDCKGSAHSSLSSS